MRPDHGERGSVTLEAVLVLPALLFTMMVIVQVALFAHAANLADASAREGARSLRLTGKADVGRQRAMDFLHEHGAQIVLEPVVGTQAVRGVASVEVSGRAVALLPGLSLPVHGHSAGPVEAFTAVKVTP